MGIKEIEVKAKARKCGTWAIARHLKKQGVGLHAALKLLRGENAAARLIRTVGGE